MRGNFAVVLDGPMMSVPKLAHGKNAALALYQTTVDSLFPGEGVALLQGNFTLRSQMLSSTGRIFELFREEELGQWPEFPDSFESPLEVKRYVQGCALAVPKKHRRKAWLDARERALTTMKQEAVNPYDANYTIMPFGYRFPNGSEVFGDFLFWEDYRFF